MPVDITTKETETYTDPSTGDEVTVTLRPARGAFYQRWRERFTLAMFEKHGDGENTAGVALAIMGLLPEFGRELIVDADGAVVTHGASTIPLRASLADDNSSHWIEQLATAEGEAFTDWRDCLAHFYPDIVMMAASDNWQRFGLVSLSPLAVPPAGVPSTETPESSGTPTPAG